MKKILTILCAIVVTASSCNNSSNCNNQPVTTDPTANKTQFLGVWYEIASIPQFFNTGCNCTKAEYIDNGSNIIVKNGCRLGGATIGTPNNITGTATVPSPNDFSKLKVKFPVSPTAADYWILSFDPNGQYMLVGDPQRNSLFVLSRSRTLSPNIYNNLMGIATSMCYDVSKVKKTDQIACNN